MMGIEDNPFQRENMMAEKKPSGKVVPILLVVLLLIVIAAAAGYYISLVRFDRKSERLEAAFNAFESKHEMTLASLRSEVMDIQASIQDREGRAEEETKTLRLKSILLKAKGEIISSNIFLTQGDPDKALQLLDSAIGVLKDALDMAEGPVKDKIEEVRLGLATVKGIIQVNSVQAQKELDRLWREIDLLAENS